MSGLLRIAVVGCGAIAEAHAAAIAESRDATLVAGVDPDEKARGCAAEKWGCAAFASVDAMLDEVDVDAACVCTPPAHHRELSERLLGGGLAVLCEKPLAPRTSDAAAMVAAARQHDRALMVSSKFRFVDDIAEARRLIDVGAIGTPVYYEVTFCAQVPVAGSWSISPQLAGGGVLMDNGCHAYDVLSRVIDSPIEKVSAAFTRPTIAPDVEDTAEIHFRTRDGTLGRIALSWTYFTKDLDYLMVQGTEGGLRVGWTGGLQRRHGERDWSPFGTGYSKGGAFASQLDAFVGAVRSGPASPDPSEAIRAIGFIEAAYRAADDWRWQTVADPH